jgi:hypothetical protein
MPDWADVKDLYETDYDAADYDGKEPEYTAPAVQPQRDPHSMQIELPGLPRFMKLPGPLQRLARKSDYRMAVQEAFAARMCKLPQGFAQIHGGKTTAELFVTVCVKPPRGLPGRWKDSMRQSMLSGFIRPSTRVKLDYTVTIIARALCSKPMKMVRRRACIARIIAEVRYAEHESVIIRLRKERQFYNIHMR